MKNTVIIKLKESLASVLPLAALVVVLHFFLELFSKNGGMPIEMFAKFIIGTVLLIFGMTLFTLGADIAMIPMGERIGAHLTRSKKYLILIPCCFLIGMLITVAEPDLTVLASQFPSINDWTIILTVAVGVGFFLVLAFMRVLKGIALSIVLVLCYVLLFVVAAFCPDDFLAVAFDSGGVTTGPITVPFIMAMGIGLATVRGGKSSQDDSFGMIALCSVGPIMAMLLLGMFANVGGANVSGDVVVSSSVLGDYLHALPEYLGEVAIALLPIVALFLLFQFVFLKLPWRTLARLTIGIIYTYIGLTIFLVGVNVGFLPAGHYLGQTIASFNSGWLLVPIGIVMGFFVVMAEPAVRVLNEQVEEITVGAVTRKAMLIMLCIGVSASVGLAMLRVVTGISIWYFLIGGYAIAIGLSFIVPKIFTAIAFDSGGVASGPMTASFLLPFANGACVALDGNILTDAFGLVALVAMAPTITIQILGLVYSVKLKHSQRREEKTDDSVVVIEFELEEAV